MNTIAILPIVTALVGLLVYSLSTNAKVCELGRLAFGTGLLITLLVFAEHLVRL